MVIIECRRTLSWEAHIWADKRQLYLGSFSSAAHASVAHDIMALKARGAGEIRV